MIIRIHNALPTRFPLVLSAMAFCAIVTPSALAQPAADAGVGAEVKAGAKEVAKDVKVASKDAKEVAKDTTKAAAKDAKHAAKDAAKDAVTAAKAEDADADAKLRAEKALVDEEARHNREVGAMQVKQASADDAKAKDAARIDAKYGKRYAGIQAQLDKLKDAPADDAESAKKVAVLNEQKARVDAQKAKDAARADGKHEARSAQIQAKLEVSKKEHGKRVSKIDAE